jgi:hypothetical protein
MADEKPFKINRSALPTESARQLFNTENCFARGELTMAHGKPVLTGECQVVQFGRNSRGNNCMVVCQTDFSIWNNQQSPVLASFVFDHQGRAIEFYFGNSVMVPTFRTKVHNGTRASFGFQPPPPPPQLKPPQPNASWLSRIREINEELRHHHNEMSKEKKTNFNTEKRELISMLEKEEADALEAAKAARDAYDELIKTQRWGCTSVLKGPLEFVGCQRGSQYVSCVEVSADFNQQLDTSPENLPNIKPYFKYDPVTKISTVGASATEYYDGYGFGNVGGNQGFQSFVVSDSNGRISTMETRQGSCPYPKPIPERLRASFPETNKKFKLMLMKGNASLRSEMKALKWLADEETRLEFPTEIDSTFAARAFVWVHELSTKFEVPRVLSLSDAALTKMIKSTTKASVAAMHSPAMRESLLAEMTKLPIGPKPIFKSCECNPMRHNPNCPNTLCPFRHARLEELGFVWPRLHFASGEPGARQALEDEISGATRAEAAASEAKHKVLAAASEAKHKALAAAVAKQQAADANQEERNSRARKATALRKASAAAASSSAAPVRRRTTRVSTADEPVASGVKRSTDSADQKTTKRKARGGSKSKRRFRK